jgi:hypothetical protein
MKRGAITILILLLATTFVAAEVVQGNSTSSTTAASMTPYESQAQIKEELREANAELMEANQERREAIMEANQEFRETLNETMQIRRELHQETMENIREKLQEGEELSIAEKGLVLRKINNDMMELKAKQIAVKTRLQLNNEGNLSELKAKLSNGRNAEIKVMPEVASQKALKRLRLKNCNESQNCTIELKETGRAESVLEENKIRPVYEVKRKRVSRFLGIFKTNMDVEAQVDAETGEVIKTKKPWWAFLASEPEEE